MSDKNKTAFEVDGRITLLLDQDLANHLGDLILSTDTKNPALLAIGHKLKAEAMPKQRKKSDSTNVQ